MRILKVKMHHYFKYCLKTIESRFQKMHICRQKLQQMRMWKCQTLENQNIRETISCSRRLAIPE